MAHIGIVACSAEGAALCYRTLCAEGGSYDHPEVSLHGHSFGDYVRALDAGDWRSVAELMLSSAEKLTAAGADFLICPDNTIHNALPLVQPRSPRPWLHIAEVVASTAMQRGFHRIAILGTRWLVSSDVYQKKLGALGLEAVRPRDNERDEIGRIIMEELVRGVFDPKSTAYVQQTIARMKDEGCDAVALACTELPIIINDENSALPALDSTRLLARAALQRAR